MSLTLSPEFSARVQAKLAGSGFSSAEQMLEHALDTLALQQQEAADQKELVRGIEEAIAELDQGKGRPHEEVWSRIEARLDQRLRT